MLKAKFKSMLASKAKTKERHSKISTKQAIAFKSTLQQIVITNISLYLI